jgi:hypothetical protein
MDDDYEITITDGIRALTDELMAWELDAGRPVTVRAEFDPPSGDPWNTPPPRAQIKIREDDDRGETYAVIECPGAMGMRKEAIPALIAVLKRACLVAVLADECIRERNEAAARNWHDAGPQERAVPQ